MSKTFALRVLVGALTSAVFAAEVLTPDTYALGALYALVILTASPHVCSNTLRGLAWAGTGLTLTSALAFSSGGDPVAVLVNRGISLLAIWVTAVLAVRWRRASTEVDLLSGIRRQTTFFQSLLDSMVDGVAVVDVSGHFQMFNPAAEKILKIGETDTGPEQWSEAYGLYLPDQKTPFPHEQLPLVRGMKGETVRDVEIFVRHSQIPQGIWLSVSASPIMDSNGKVVGGVAVFRDVSDQKRVQEEINRAREAADSASKAKSAFLANMSHEMRTPMNAIIGLTELVLDSRVTAEQREYLSLVRTSSESLLTLIDDTLDLSMIEAGKLELKPVVFDPQEVVCDTVKSLAFQAHGKGLELICSIDPKVPAAVKGDPGRLGQVLVNLIGNAIKFTSHGEIVVRVRVSESGSDVATLLISVSDTGIGIPENKLRPIFEDFEQVDPSPSRQFGGAGLGLAISTKLVELMGGSIWVESEVDRGSTFHFTADFEVEEGPRPEQTDDLAGRRVLVVDTNATSRQVLCELLERWGMRTDERSDPRRVLATRSPETGYDLYLIHSGLFDLEGLDLAEALIKKQRDSRGTVIMMLTTGDRPGGVERCEAIGVDGYVLKPVKPSELMETIRSAGRADRISEPEDKKSRGHDRSLKILLAEDSPANQRLATGLLEHWGHRVTVVNNGKEAIAETNSHLYDLVLMDMQMPEMDGLEATKIIRSRPRQAPHQMPIYALTARSVLGDQERCMAVGMNGYISKPIRVEELFSLIDEVVTAGAKTETVSGSPPFR